MAVRNDNLFKIPQFFQFLDKRSIGVDLQLDNENDLLPLFLHTGSLVLLGQLEIEFKAQERNTLLLGAQQVLGECLRRF